MGVQNSGQGMGMNGNVGGRRTSRRRPTAARGALGAGKIAARLVAGLRPWLHCWRLWLRLHQGVGGWGGVELQPSGRGGLRLPRTHSMAHAHALTGASAA